MSPSLRSVKSVKEELEDPELRAYLARYLRRRLPTADADDALQAVYCAALEARRRPEDPVELRRWMTVIARRKVAAMHARSSTEQLGDPPEQSVPPAPVEELSLVRWAEQQAATSQVEHVDETLEWMARESEGERLESIAAEMALPSARVRQRVFRLRRFMKARWALELSVALLALVIAWWLWSRRTEQLAKPLPPPTPSRSLDVPPPIEAPQPAIDSPAPVPPAPVPPGPGPTPLTPLLAVPTTPTTQSPQFITPGSPKPPPSKAKKGTPTTGTPMTTTPF